MGGAKAVGLAHRIGGSRAKTRRPGDRNRDLPESQPGFDPVQDIMLVSRARSVDTVICNA